MKKYKYLAAVLGISMVLTMAGCGKKQDSVVEATPTPEATAAPTAVPVTVTPVPTSTPAPKVIGVKTTDAKFVYLTNSLSSDLREIYLMTSGGEDWGKNLIPSESSVKGAEQVQMYYTPSTESTDSEDTSEDSTEDTSSTSTELYDMKIVTSDGNTYEIYSIDLGDMEKASLTMDTDSETAYLRYMSLSEKKEKDTRDNSQQTSSSDDESSDDSSYDDSSDDSSDDGSYDDSGYDSSDDGSYDDSSDDGSDDGSYDDGNYDDGSYDDGSDDGSYDDSGYVDDSGDDGYDTDWN